VNGNPRVISFDCYGTLIDWEGGIGSFLYAYALRHQADPTQSGDTMRREWEAIQFLEIQGRYRLYKDILAESLRQWAKSRDLPYRDEDGNALVRAMRSWQPFPDTRPALLRAREAGVRLAILSNTDRDIIAHSLRHLDLPFDLVITAEDCGSHKPSPRNFDRLIEELEVPPADILHVAFGFKYDIGPASRRGLRTAWVNRHIEEMPEGEQPDDIWRDLWGLPGLLGVLAPNQPPGEGSG
jgi:2-haloalkanoic acid dehalogenase type II